MEIFKNFKKIPKIDFIAIFIAKSLFFIGPYFLEVESDFDSGLFIARITDKNFPTRDGPNFPVEFSN